MQYPKIRIYDSFLLNGDVIPLLLPRLKEEGRAEEASKKFIKQRVVDYNDAWRPYEDRILRGMCDVLDLEFTQNTIDVYIAPFHHSFSDPMVIATKYSPDRFIEVLAHEILHRLLTDNTKYSHDNIGLLDEWKQLFGDNHSWNTLVHIPVHLILKHLFVDVLNEPERLGRDIRLMQKYQPYKQAWEYVESVDYKAMIAKLKDLYGVLVSHRYEHHQLNAYVSRST